MASRKKIGMLGGMMVGLGCSLASYGSVMGTMDLLGGVGSVNNATQQAAWTLELAGTGRADFNSTYYGSDSPYSIRLLSTWDVPAGGQYAKATASLSSVAGRVHKVDLYARKVNNNNTTMAVSFAGTGYTVSGLTTSWQNKTFEYSVSGSGNVTYTLEIRDTAPEAYQNGINVDVMRVYREIATPQVTSQSASEVMQGASAAITLGNGGGDLNSYLVAFDPDAVVSWVSGAAVTVDSYSWTSDNQLLMNVTAGTASGLATFSVANPYGGQTSEFTLNVVPEPATLGLLAMGLVGIVFRKK